MGTYIIINDQDPILKKARATTHKLWLDNFHAADLASSTKSSYEMRSKNLFSEKGFDELHSIIFETIAQDQDPENNAYKTHFFQGLCDKLKQEGITYDSIKNCLRPQSRENMERIIANRAPKSTNKSALKV